MTKKSYRCLGIMTGNSLDAVDVVLTEFSQKSINLKRNIRFSPILQGICKRTVSALYMVT